MQWETELESCGFKVQLFGLGRVGLSSQEPSLQDALVATDLGEGVPK